MENSKTSCLLWVICLVITVSLLLFNLTGYWLSIEFLAVSGLALICWLKFSYRRIPGQNAVMPVYILSITLFLLLGCIRFSSDYAMFLQRNMHGLFKSDLIIDHVNWFILMICLPVATMLAGGYFLARGKLIGFFFAWWTFFFCVAESVLQFRVELFNPNLYEHRYFLGMIAAMGLFLICIYAILKLADPRKDGQPFAAFDSPTQRKVNLWSALFITLAIIYGITLYSQAGLLPVGVIAGSMMGGMIGWRKTTARFPADPYRVVPLYLLLQAMFYIHVGEETLTHFNRGIAAISGHPWNDSQFTYLIAFIGPIVWIFAAWSLWKRQAFGNFVLWFMIVGMILGEPTHVLVFPVIRMVKDGAEYGYFSGMYTALFPMIPAILALISILSDRKRRKIAHA